MLRLLPRPRRLPLRPLLRLLLLALPVVLAARSTVPATAADDWTEAKKAFAKALKSPDWKARSAGWSEISYHDTAESVAEALAALAKEEHPMVLLTAIRTLAGYGGKASKEALVQAVRKGKDPVRLYVLLALAEQPGEGAKEVLLEALASKDGTVAAQAALAMGRKQMLEAKPHLLALLQHKDWHLRAAGARGLRFLAGTPQPAQPGKPAPPATPAALTGPEVLNALVDALTEGQGRERGDVIATLKRLTQQDFAYDPPAWRALAGGAKPDAIARNPLPCAYICGVPVLGRRVVVLTDNNVRTEDVIPFDMARLRELGKVPGARDVPPFGIQTIKQFLNAHAKRLVNDLPDGTLFDLIVVGGKARDVFGRLTPANNGTRATAITALEAAKVETANDTFVALESALDLAGRKDSVAWDSGPEELVYLAVAVPWLAETTDPAVVAAAIALKARLRMVAINTVGIGEHPYELCQNLAESTGGTYVNLSK